MNSTSLDRRELIAGLSGFGAVLVAARADAQSKPATAPNPHAGHHMADAAPAAPVSNTLQAVIKSTADCQRDGRVCLARCTDHLATGAKMMADCQRAVMNMLAVVGAMAEVAVFRSASEANIKALASTCAAFCRACAKACEPHAQHHEECKACLNSCIACAKACEALAA